ncbi:DUF6496 domain-containing protein [Paracraurococcus lichenis]|uniref:DUF6496 domain-containing protein n=1 Tax=Paracraurococcus lichenis TaxID=3064888 RepID=A0ABT9DUQ3_9PROT|nr:DUF6496 domain-containing protein [Paracraurococcus sp. LOR1-02]MDO9707630.1 DUF6496 domain-containing protein [Paracraurococcus sp. LOR1-02]
MAKESKAQRETVERVMREWKEGDLETSRGAPVRSQRQAVAIALHEAGASRDETPEKNRANLRRSKARERKAEETRASLYAEATRRGIQGRSRMTKEELVRALRPH